LAKPGIWRVAPAPVGHRGFDTLELRRVAARFSMLL